MAATREIDQQQDFIKHKDRPGEYTALWRTLTRQWKEGNDKPVWPVDYNDLPGTTRDDVIETLRRTKVA